MFKVKRKILIPLIVTLLFIVTGCQAEADESSTDQVEISDVKETQEISIEETEATDPLTPNQLSPIPLNADEFASMLKPPEGYRYVVLTKPNEGDTVRNAVPVPEDLFKDDDCLTIVFQDVTPYLEENYPDLMHHEISSEDNPELEILDETSLSIDDTGVSEDYVNNTVIVNDVVSTGTELPKEAVRPAVESFAQSFGPVSSDKLVLTTLTTDIGDFEVYIYEYEHENNVNISKIGVFFPLGTNMHLLQVIQEGDINAPSPFMDAINAILTQGN